MSTLRQARHLVLRRGRSLSAVVYHDQRDFDWHELREREQHRLGGAAAVDDAAAAAAAASSRGQLDVWERHHRAHAAAPVPFFRERRYLLRQFPALQAPGLRLLEPGCGNGSATLPVLRGNATARVHATDVSATAVQLTRDHVERAGFLSRLTAAVVGADDPAGGGGLQPPYDAALLCYTASAVPAGGDQTLLRRISAALRPGGLVCFRDYGLFDLRHLADLDGAARGAARAQPCVRLSDRSFVRPGGAFRRYYSLEDLAALAEGAGLALDEGRYGCTRLENRRRGLTMDRVYVHGLLRKLEVGAPCSSPTG